MKIKKYISNCNEYMCSSLKQDILVAHDEIRELFLKWLS